MTFHSDYHTYGFKTAEIAVFLAKHGIHIARDDSSVTYCEPTPDWAIKYQGLKSFKLSAAAEIMAGADPSYSGCLSDDGQAEFFVSMQLLEQAIEDGVLRTGKDINGNITVFDSEIRNLCKSIGRVWCIPMLGLVQSEATDADLLNSLQEVQREKAELTQRLAVLQGQHDEREVLKQKASALAKAVVRLEGEKAAFQVELKGLRADALIGKNKSTLLTLVGGLAMAGCGVDIHSSRIKGINQMLNDLATMGVSINDDTLRLHLKAAAELIPKPK